MFVGRASDRRFQLYWAGQTLSGLGDAFALVALPLLALQATGSVSTMGLVSASAVVATVVTGIFAGSLVDRADRRRLMIACDAGRAVVFGIVPLWWGLAAPSLPLLYVVAIAGGALGTVFSVAHMAAVPALVPPERLHSANARLQGSLALSYVVGTVVAGAVCARAGPATALVVDATSFVVSIASLAAIRFDPLAGANDGAVGEPRFGAGARFVVLHPTLRAITILMIVLGLTSNVGLSAGISDLIIFHLEHELALGHQAVGACLGTAALGAVLGAAAAPAVVRRIGAGTSIVAGTGLQSVGLVTLGMIPSALASAAGGFLWGAGMMVRSVPVASVRQSVVPPELLGRATAASWMAIFGASAVGTAIATRVAAGAGASATLSAIGTVVGAVAIAGAFAPAIRRAVRPAAPVAFQQEP